MNKTYWIKKEPNCNLNGVDWIELNGIEFYKFINSPESKGRYFIDFDDMKIEADKSEYVKWRKENNHRNYIFEQESKFITLSMNYLCSDDSLDGEGVIADISIDVESEVEVNIMIENIHKAILTLTCEERCLIHSLFFEQISKTESELSKELKISQSTVNKRKRKIFTKIKEFWE